MIDRFRLKDIFGRRGPKIETRPSTKAFTADELTWRREVNTYIAWENGQPIEHVIYTKSPAQKNGA